MSSYLRSVAEWAHILTPEPPPLLCKPTRDITWSESRMRGKLLEEIQSFKAEAESVKAANILLLGHIGSGKSSFLNSINMVFVGRLTQVAIPGTSGKTFTTKLGCHDLEPVEGKALPVKLYDTTGLEAHDDMGIHEDDLFSTIMGHVRTNYEYNPSCAIKEDNPKYRKAPNLGDRMHCVVHVIDCRRVSLMLQSLLKKYNTLRELISKEGIPQVVILPHCEAACIEVEKDLTMVFRSKYINEKMNEVSMTLGIPLHYIFPVKNYSTEVETSTNMDILLLSTFKHMINFAGDFIKKTSKKPTPETQSPKPPPFLTPKPTHFLTPKPTHTLTPKPPHILTPKPPQPTPEPESPKPPHKIIWLPSRFSGGPKTTDMSASAAVQCPALLDEPKRQINWSAETRDKLLDDIKSFKPEAESVQAAKILMLGHVGSGKSSFVNSINTVFAGRLRQNAQVGTGEGSFTLKFRFWNIKPVQGKALPVQLCDTMGLEDKDNNGISEEDLMRTIMGHVQKDYVYNPIQPIQPNDPKYTPDPLLGDRMHCVVYLINCCSISVLTKELLNKYKNLRKRISNKEIPQVAILTHCDEACAEVEKDLTNIFRSRYISEKMNEASQKLGIALNCVFPVINYSTQVDTTTNMDVLMLSSFKHMINYAGDFISENINSD